MGWKRFGRYLAHRVIRMNDSSSKMARGIACGVAVSFTPLPGSHILQAAVLAWIIRGNIVASLLGTIAGNPWTFPPMWAAAWWTGSTLFGALGLQNGKDLEAISSLADLWTMLTTQPMEVAVPWIVGGYLCAAFFWAPSFYLARALLRHAHHIHHSHKRHLKERKSGR